MSTGCVSRNAFLRQLFRGSYVNIYTIKSLCDRISFVSDIFIDERNSDRVVKYHPVVFGEICILRHVMSPTKTSSKILESVCPLHESISNRTSSEQTDIIFLLPNISCAFWSTSRIYCTSHECYLLDTRSV